MQTVSHGGSAHSDEPNEYQRLGIRLRIAGLAGIPGTRAFGFCACWGGDRRERSE